MFGARMFHAAGRWHTKLSIISSRTAIPSEHQNDTLRHRGCDETKTGLNWPALVVG